MLSYSRLIPRASLSLWRPTGLPPISDSRGSAWFPGYHVVVKVFTTKYAIEIRSSSSGDMSNLFGKGSLEKSGGNL